MKPFNVLLSTVLLSTTLIITSTLSAQEYDNSANFNFGAIGYFFDSERNQDDDIGVAFGGELPLADRWSVASDYFTLKSEMENFSGSADVDYFRIGMNYHFNQISGWQPYAGFGLGKFDIDSSVPSPNELRETGVDVGFGVKRYLTENMLFRTDYKMIFGDESSALDSVVTVGIALPFGRRSSAPAAPVASSQTEATSPTMMDSDNDGVQDSSDACRNTPAGASVDSRGCEIDSDRDGVVDSRDNCADTPVNLAVDNNGCPQLEVTQRRQELLVNFEFDRAEVRPQFDNEIGDFAEFMATYGNTDVVIEGHTDSEGSEEYNQGLSERRANAVRDELVNEHNIESRRISTVGYGESRPVDTNDTAAGRANNRRIEAVISVEVEEQRRR